jgi:hypothetical protein
MMSGLADTFYAQIIFLFMIINTEINNARIMKSQGFFVVRNL